MKKITLLTFVLFSVLSYAQVGINTNTPDESSALDIESSTGGILIPRLTETQRDAISSPATGLMIYQTDQTTGFYFYDGTAWTKIDGVAGPQGEQGPAGADGQDGAAGTNGTNGSDGADGNGISSTVDNGDGTFTLTFDDGSTFTTSDFTGPAGAAGTNGTNGSDGADGADGNGIASTTDNNDGTFTITYTDNTTFTTSDLTGPTGAAGTNGTNGSDGADGADGTDGNGISSTVDNGDGTFTLTFDDGSTFTTSDFTGPTGATGSQGPTGAAGTNGTNGSDGADGKGISSTVDNGDGTFTITYTDNTTFTTSDFTGPTGATGPQGPQGETVPANSAIITNSYSINDIEGLNDGDLVFNTSSHKLYIYMDPSMTTTDAYSDFLNNNTTSSTTTTNNTSYIISFQVSKRIEIEKITDSDGGNYASARPYIFEDNNNINDGLGTRIYNYLSTNENPNLILSPNVTYRILYIGYGNNYSITCSNINNYDYDSSLFLNLQTHKTSDITAYYSIPEAYTLEVTNTTPNFTGNADHELIFSFSGVNNLLLIGTY